MTIIDIKTTGHDYSKDHITGVSVLSFSRIDGVFMIIDSFEDALTEAHPINWDKVANMLMRSQSLLSHKNSTNRKFLEFATPPGVQCRVRALPSASTTFDIDWKSRNTSNNSLKYLSFIYGHYFDPDCLKSQNYATLNLLHVVDGAFDELVNRLQKNQTVILLTGPFCKAIRNELKREGFQYSPGSGNMGKGWWAYVDDDETNSIIHWLIEAKKQAEGKNDIYFKNITPLERYSIRAEFKAAKMIKVLPPKTAANKRSREELEEDETVSSSSRPEANVKVSKMSMLADTTASKKRALEPPEDGAIPSSSSSSGSIELK
jgi:hypothetical protein